MKKVTRIFSIIIFSGFLVSAVHNTNDFRSHSNEWKELLDSKTIRFWKEGNHLPDEGFLIFATNPNMENARNWILRMETKAKQLEVLLKFAEKAHAELVSEGKVIDRYSMVTLIPQLNKTYDNKKFKDVMLYFLFSDSCPHCAKQAKSLIGIKNIIPLQINDRDLKNWEGLPLSKKADKKTLQEYMSDGVVPKLVLYNAKNKTASVINGNQTLVQIIQSADLLVKGKISE